MGYLAPTAAHFAMPEAPKQTPPAEETCVKPSLAPTQAAPTHRSEKGCLSHTTQAAVIRRSRAAQAGEGGRTPRAAA